MGNIKYRYDKDGYDEYGYDKDGKEKQIKISDLTDQELERMIGRYKN